MGQDWILMGRKIGIRFLKILLFSPMTIVLHRRLGYLIQVMSFMPTLVAEKNSFSRCDFTIAILSAISIGRRW